MKPLYVCLIAVVMRGDARRGSPRAALSVFVDAITRNDPRTRHPYFDVTRRFRNTSRAEGEEWPRSVRFR